MEIRDRKAEKYAECYDYPNYLPDEKMGAARSDITAEGIHGDQARAQERYGRADQDPIYMGKPP